MNTPTIRSAIDEYIESVSLARSENTARTYRNGMKSFCDMLEKNEIDADSPITVLNEDLFNNYVKYSKYYSSTTENLYINVAKKFYEFLNAQNYSNYNLSKIKYLIRQRSRKPGIRLPQFPEKDILTVIDYALSLPGKTAETEEKYLINLRDSAFIITLADTGLRIHEACNLRRGNIDWEMQKAMIIGKGNKQGIIRFSDRSINSMRNYLLERQHLDGKCNKPLSSMPIFARHDKGAGNDILPITTKTGRLIIEERVEECLGKNAVGTITPHSFRHYFVTTVLRKTDNLKIAQEFARHASITVTQRYVHLASDELDRTYRNIFDEKYDTKDTDND